jgi:hypothetical protein
LLPVVEQVIANTPGLGAMRSVYGVALADVGDADGAAKVLASIADDGIAALARDATYSSVLANLAEIIAATGDTELLDATYERLLPFAGQLLVVAWGVFSPGAADRYLGMLDAQAGRMDAARQRFDAAIGLETRAGADGLRRATESWRERLVDDR